MNCLDNCRGSIETGTGLANKSLFMIVSVVEYPPNPIASCEFKQHLLRNQEQLSTHLWRTFFQRIFQVFLQLMAITKYLQKLDEVRLQVMAIRVNCAAEHVPCCDLKPFSRVISPLEKE